LAAGGEVYRLGKQKEVGPNQELMATARTRRVPVKRGDHSRKGEEETCPNRRAWERSLRRLCPSVCERAKKETVDGKKRERKAENKKTPPVGGETRALRREWGKKRTVQLDQWQRGCRIAKIVQI